MSNQCIDCSAEECKIAIVDSEGIVINVIIANHHDDLEALNNLYEFETTVECCNIEWVNSGDKWDSENNVFIDNYFSPGFTWNENGKYVAVKHTPWKNHPDYVEPEPTTEPTALEIAEEKLTRLGLTKEDLQALLA
jgi:hypothetical protein